MTLRTTAPYLVKGFPWPNPEHICRLYEVFDQNRPMTFVLWIHIDQAKYDQPKNRESPTGKLLQFCRQRYTVDVEDFFWLDYDSPEIVNHLDPDEEFEDPRIAVLIEMLQPEQDKKDRYLENPMRLRRNVKGR